MKNNTIQLFEYEKSKNSLPKLVGNVRKLNKSLFRNDGETGLLNLISNNRIKAGNYVGIVQMGRQTIEVLPKVLSERAEDSSSFIRKNLLFMLKYISKLDIKETDIAGLKKTNDLFEIIIHLFAKNLLELLKKDFVKNYNQYENNNSYLKGKLLIVEQINHNLYNESKFYCRFDIFTENHLLNQIFKATVSKLLKINVSRQTYKLLSNSAFILQDIQTKNITFQDCNKIKFNRLNGKYKTIFNLAKLLLFGNSTELFSLNIDSYSIMFDMNKLFEEFIGEFIRRNFKEEIQEIKTPKANKYVFSKPVADKFSRFQLQPDIFIRFKNGKILIIDTKYKELKQDKINYGVSQSDIYQMVMYGLRYFDDNAVKEEKKKIVLLYPQYDFSINELNIELETKENIIIKIKTVNLHNNLLKTKDKLKNELHKILN